MGPNNPFTFSTLSLDGICVIRCSGELDLAAADELSVVIANRLRIEMVVLDASGISFLDCAGLTAFLRSANTGRRMRRSFALAAPSPAVLRLLAAAEARDLLDVYPSVPEAALAAVRAESQM